MLTLFTIPKPFQGHIDIIQRNAIRSWILLRPKCEIILFGDDRGTREIAAEFGVCHVPDVACNEHGTPLLNDVFEKAQRLATHNVLCYVNADIMLTSDFMRAVEQAQRCKRRFLMVGRRWDVDMQGQWDFEQPDWDERLRACITEHGKLHSPLGSDYFVFTRGTVVELPPFAVGRAGWDNWLIYRARALGVPVIDASLVTTVIHQDHDYSHVKGGDKESWKGPETDRNRELIGGGEYVFTLEDATWLLTSRWLVPALTKQHLRRRWEVLPILHPRLRAPVRLLKRALRAPHRVPSAILRRMNRVLGNRA